MSLPPDPHDDDLAEPPTPPPAAAGTGQTPAPPPPPPGAGSDAPLPPPTSPAYPQPFEAAPAPPTVPTSLAVDPAGSATGAPPTSAAGGAGGGADGTAAFDAGTTASTSSGRKSRLGLALAGVVAVIVLAAGVVLATGASDESDADTASDSSSTDAAEEGEADAGTDSQPSDDAPAESELGAVPGGDGTDDDGPADAPTGDESPVVAAEEFFEAVSSGDCAGMVARMTADSFGTEGQTQEDAVDECESDAAGTAAASQGRWEDVQLISMDGDEATVGVTLHVGSQQSERELPMVLDDGEWKMDLDVTAGSGL